MNMLTPPVIFSVAFLYLCLLFAIAYWGDMRADRGRSILKNPIVYAGSIAVYCTSWTFYGSVGRAASSGISFLPIYLGPTLMAALWWVVLRKMVRISKANRIVSIADFISSRYGKSSSLGGLATVIAVVGIMPYISLQLKAVSSSVSVLLSYPDIISSTSPASIVTDTAFYVALVMALFAILFGTRHIDASEHHEGMVAAIAFESLVKLLAFLAVGLFVTFALFDGPSDIFARAASVPDLAKLFVLPSGAETGSFVALTLLSGLMVICLPRQFQVAVVENTRESHIRTAIWLFPLYLLAINLFVLPIAFGGLLLFGTDTIDSDMLVLALPLAERQSMLALFVFIGGLSAATGMIIVEAVALSTMVCNDLVMPVLLRLPWLGLTKRPDLSRLLLAIRRGTILTMLLLGYFYVRTIGESFALVTIGLVSFAAAAQFAPAMLGGMFWKGATKAGALAGLSAGFLMWLYTLLLPSFVRSGWLQASLIDQGPFGIALLKPYALFGLTGLDSITHGLLWSLLANLAFYIGVSLATGQSAMERIQAALFVDAFLATGTERQRYWRGRASVGELRELAGRFVGVERADHAFAAFARNRNRNRILQDEDEADPDLAYVAERLLAGAIGAASARVMMASVAKGEAVRLEEVMEIVDEASQVIAYSQRLETKSRELEAATTELRAANERLKELDRLKDDFISTVTHELRTPLTSIRSFSEILHDNPDMDANQRADFLRIVIAESERLTRLINQVLDLAKLESGAWESVLATMDIADPLRAAAEAVRRIYADKRVTLEVDLPESGPLVAADRDRLIQVAINLLSNAVKFAPAHTGRVRLGLSTTPEAVCVTVADNGPGVPVAHRRTVFEKFHQVGDTLTEKPAGSGLGLAICSNIIAHLGGRIWVEDSPLGGALFAFTLPRVLAAENPSTAQPPAVP